MSLSHTSKGPSIISMSPTNEFSQKYSVSSLWTHEQASVSEMQTSMLKTANRVIMNMVESHTNVEHDLALKISALYS